MKVSEVHFKEITKYLLDWGTVARKLGLDSATIKGHTRSV